MFLPAGYHHVLGAVAKLYSVALETSACRDGDEWVLDRAKRWIGNGSIADVVIVWARRGMRSRPTTRL
jgi:alkylation response protein AidB-like acyl-CoA dehydrogenase